MQNLIVNNQSELANLQLIKPQGFSFTQSETLLSSNKSFSDYVNEAKMSSESYERSENADNRVKTENTEKKSENKIEKNETISEKPSDINEEEKKSLALKEPVEKEKTTVKKNKKVDFSENKLLKQENHSEKLTAQENIQDKKEVKSNKNNKKIVSEKVKLEKDVKNFNKTEENNENFSEDASLKMAFNTFGENVKTKETEQTENEKLLDSEDDIELSKSNSVKKGKNFYLDDEKKISVKDLRTNEEELTSNKNNETKEKKSLYVSEVHYDKNNSKEISMDVSLNVQQNLSSLNNQTASSDGSSFQAMLKNHIQQNASEIVKAGNIVLKDNNVGQIKLILHPESLGNVKIDLHLNDKNITGRIVVSSQEAFNAFKETAENLRQAFTQNGFDSASLELSFSNNNFNQNLAGQNQENPASEFVMRKVYESQVGFDSSDVLSNETDFFEKSSRNSINIVA